MKNSVGQEYPLLLINPVLPIIYLSYFSLKKADFVMMGDFNSDYIAHNRVYILYSIFQLNMSIFMCFLDKKDKTEMVDHSAFP